MITDKQSLLIDQAQKRIEFAVVLAVFFPTLVQTLLGLTDRPDHEITHIVLRWTSLVAFYLLIYLLFQLTKNYIRARPLGWVNGLLLLGIGTFLLPVARIVSEFKGPLTWLSNISTDISLYAMQIVPILILIILAFLGGKHFIRWVFKK